MISYIDAYKDHFPIGWIGTTVLDALVELCIADSKHQWSGAPYDYVREFYHWVSD